MGVEIRQLGGTTMFWLLTRIESELLTLTLPCIEGGKVSTWPLTCCWLDSWLTLMVWAIVDLTLGTVHTVAVVDIPVAGVRAGKGGTAPPGTRFIAVELTPTLRGGGALTGLAPTTCDTAKRSWLDALPLANDELGGLGVSAFIPFTTWQVWKVHKTGLSFSKVNE